MTTGISVLIVLLILVSCWFVLRWILLEREAGRRQNRHELRPTLGDFLIGFIFLFFDTFGIGAFAPTISVLKLQQRVRDEDMPGTLNVGHALPAVAEALIFISVISVDFATLIGMTVAAVLGALFGVRVVSRLPRRGIQIGMGFALLVAAMLSAAKNLHWMPDGGDALGLHGAILAFAVGMSFLLGALMMLGIGFFAPCLILLSTLGMNPLAAFPIMMGATAFLMPIGGASFIKMRLYNLRTAIGLTLGGIPGVLIAAFVVKSLPTLWLRWLVVIVVIYAAALMLVSGLRRPSKVQVSLNEEAPSEA